MPLEAKISETATEKAQAMGRTMVMLRYLVVLSFLPLALFASEAKPYLVLLIPFCALVLLFNGIVSRLLPSLSRRILLVSWLLALSDGVLVTIAVALSGGLKSPFFLLYFLNIIEAAMCLNLQASVGIVLVDAILYLAASLLPWNSFDLASDLVYFSINVLGFLFVAAFTGLLSASEQRHRDMSVLDSLTGLYNRAYLLARLNEAILQARQMGLEVSLLMADLDNFKMVNDSYGHAKGDEVLRAIAACIKRNLKMFDIVCRYGGEEMVVVLPHLSKAQALRVAERLRAAVATEPMAAMAQTISIGVATHPEDGGTPEELLRAADIAMYQAKRQGRNRVCGHEPGQQDLRKQ